MVINGVTDILWPLWSWVFLPPWRDLDNSGSLLLLLVSSLLRLQPQGLRCSHRTWRQRPLSERLQTCLVGWLGCWFLYFPLPPFLQPIQNNIIIIIIITVFIKPNSEYRLNALYLNKCPGHWDNKIMLIFHRSLRSTQPWAAVALQRLFHTQYQHLPSQVPIYTPGWREADIVKYLAQGHKCYVGFEPTLQWLNHQSLNLTL